MKALLTHFSILLTTFAIVLAACGCSGHKEQYGDKKQDYVPSKPPSWWRAPNDPRGPGTPPGRNAAKLSPPSAPADGSSGSPAGTPPAGGAK